MRLSRFYSKMLHVVPEVVRTTFVEGFYCVCPIFSFSQLKPRGKFKFEKFRYEVLELLFNFLEKKTLQRCVTQTILPVIVAKHLVTPELTLVLTLCVREKPRKKEMRIL